jgi:WD40 repeat protein
VIEIKGRSILDFMNVVVFVPDSDLLAIGYANGTIELRSVEKQVMKVFYHKGMKKVRPDKENLAVEWSQRLHKGPIRALITNSKGSLIASLGYDRNLVITDVKKGRPVLCKPFGFVPLDCAFTAPEEIVILVPDNSFIKYQLQNCSS